MEKEFGEREGLLRSITENISDGIYRSDPERGIVYANEAFVDMFGYESLDEVRRVSSTDLYARADERERLVQIDQEQGEIDQVEVEFERKDGSTFIGLLSSRAVRDEDGTVRYYDGAITDITERKTYEDQLAYRYDLERKLVDISTRFINTPVDQLDATIEGALGTVGRFVGADRSYIFRVDEDAETVTNTHEWCGEGIPSLQPDLQAVPSSELDGFINRMYEAEPLAGAVSELPEAATGLRSILDGGGIESLVVLPMMRDGTLVGFVGFDAVRTMQEWRPDTVMVLRVLTDAIANALQRKEMEERMLEAKNEAETANRLKSAFLANMSHEIRTPLTSIIGFAEAIGDEIETIDGSERDRDADALDRFANLIERSGRRLLETLNAVLNLSKLEAGEMDLNPRPMDLGDEVAEACQLFETQARAANLDLIVENGIVENGGSETVGGRVDAGGLRIVLRNLISNAIKYTDAEGTVWVRARRTDGDANRRNPRSERPQTRYAP
ncbi:MAG: PAS domain S-box protein [Salinibacter sp.]